MSDPLSRQTNFYDLVIDSRYRENYSTTNSNSITINIEQNVNAKYRSVSLKYLTINNTVYNVNSSNNIFTITTSTGNIDITIPPNNYDINTLITELENQLQANSLDTYTINLSGLFLTITSTFLTSVLNPNSENQLFLELLGFQNNKNIDFTAGSITSTSPVNVLITKNIFIQIPEIRKKIYNTRNNQYNFIVPLTCPYTSVIFYKQATSFDQKIVVEPTNFPTIINISLFDDNNNFLDINNTDYIMVLEFEIQRNFNQ